MLDMSIYDYMMLSLTWFKVWPKYDENGWALQNMMYLWLDCKWVVGDS